MCINDHKTVVYGSKHIVFIFRSSDFTFIISLHNYVVIKSEHKAHQAWKQSNKTTL